jgi:hypothetical protein
MQREARRRLRREERQAAHSDGRRFARIGRSDRDVPERRAQSFGGRFRAEFHSSSSAYVRYTSLLP